jgi:hypothetical protein
MFLKELLSLHGVTIQGFKLKKRGKQIEKLEREKAELKKQLENKD